MQSQKTSNFVHSKIKIADIGLQNPLVKKRQNTTQQQRETQVQKMKTANKVRKAKQTSRVVVWGVGGEITLPERKFLSYRDASTLH